MRTGLFLLVSCFALSVQALAEMRTWTNPEGVEIRGEFIRAEGDSVTLRLEQGKTVTFGLDKLSQADRDWIKARPAEEAAAAPQPKVDANRKARWHTRMAKAQEEAEDTGLPMLVLFTGSDWCPYCVKLEKEVFKQQEFKDYADQNLVLLIYDFPAGGKARGEAGDKLKEHGVRSYPTYFLMDAAGKKLSSGGYFNGISPKSFAEWVKSVSPKG